MLSGPLIIGYFLGPSLVAHYTPANAVMLQLQLLSGAFLAQMTPVVTRAHAQSDLARIRRMLLRSTRYTLLITAGMMLLLASVSDEFVFIWLGPGFEDTALVLVFWCMSGILRAFMGAAFPVFLGTGRIRGITSFEVALAVFTISLSAFLVGWTPLGVIGAVLPLLAGQVIRTTVYNFLACKILGIDAAEYARESFIGPTLCLGALAVTSMTLRNLIEAEPLVRLFGIGTIGFLVYSGLSWVVGLNAQDRLKVRGYAGSGWRHLRSVAGRRELEGQNPDQNR
jgi:O-antigen/teichoic acid export membrane protein